MEKGKVYIGSNQGELGSRTAIPILKKEAPPMATRGYLQPGDVFMVVEERWKDMVVEERWKDLVVLQIFHFPTCIEGFVVPEDFHWWKIREIEL